jgi:predicted Fe-Mo cluster-binding NifX family protein
MADIQSQISQARSAGYDDAAIAQHLGSMPDYSSKVKTALSAGYAPSDIISFLAPSTRQNVNAESDVPLLAADIRRLQKQKGETVTPDQKAISEKGILRRVNDEILGAFEVPTAVGMGALGAVTAIPFGIAEAALTGKATNAEQYYKNMQYKPQTAEGRRNLEALGELVNSEALRPLQGAVNLPFNQLVPKGSIAPAVNFSKNVVGQEAKLAAQPITSALETRAAGKLADKVAQSYERGPQIDAAKEANRLGVALNPVNANPTTGNKLRALAVDPIEENNKLSQANKTRWGSIAKAEMGLPETTPLTSTKPFEQARTKAAAPYDNIRKIDTLSPDQPLTYGENKTIIQKLEDINNNVVIGGQASEKAIEALKAEAIGKIKSGISGSQAIDALSDLRKKATKTYNSNAATPEMIDVADARMAIANTIEDLIEANVNKPEELTAFRKARADMARSYAYEAATDITTGNVDPQKLNRMLDKGIPLSGDAESIARIAGNFPEVTSLTPVKREGLQRFSRSGPLGTAGAVFGSLAGIPGALVGGALGAGTGVVLSKVAAKRMATPAYQAAHAVPEDFRPPINNLRPVEPNMNRNLPVPYDYGNAVVQPGYTPNFTAPNQRPQFNPQGANPQLPPPSPESTMAGVESRRAYDLAAERAAAQQAEVQAAQQAPARAPTSGGVAFELDPITGKLREVSQGMKGATPDVMQNYGSSLESAVKKVSAGKAFDLTAEERIAFNKTKVDLAQVEPGYAKLSDKQITERMMDRQWVADTIKKAREQAIAFEQIAARADSEQAKMTAMAQRQRMMDFADSMEEKMRQGRPDNTRKSQGPKTREAKRNALASDNENKNALAR